MHTEKITIDRGQAAELYRSYKKHQAYSEPIDWEIQRTYQLIAQGKLIIRALESIKQAGLNENGLPKLALAVATAKAAHIRRERNGSMIMSPSDDFWRVKHNHFRFREETFNFAAHSWPTYDLNGKRYWERSTDHRAMLPMIPIHLRPKRALQNYHVLWEAEWEPVPPRDPYLLRRIGKADLWLVVAHWDLTDVERAALATRI